MKSDSRAIRIITLLVVRRNAALVAEGDEDSFPRQISPRRANSCVNRPRRISAGKRDAKFAALRRALHARFCKNEIGRVANEIVRADNVRVHRTRSARIRSRNASGRAFRDNADDILPRDRTSAPARFASRSGAENVRFFPARPLILRPRLSARASNKKSTERYCVPTSGPWRFSVVGL